MELKLQDWWSLRIGSYGLIGDGIQICIRGVTCLRANYFVCLPFSGHLEPGHRKSPCIRFVHVYKVSTVVRKLGRWAGFLSASTLLGGVDRWPCSWFRIGKASLPKLVQNPPALCLDQLTHLLPALCYPLNSPYPLWFLAAFPLCVHPSLLIYILSSASQPCLST